MMKYPFFKSLFLGTVLSLSFPLSPLAMETDDDARDLGHAQAPHGQSVPGAFFVTTFKGSSFQDFPPEIIRYIIDFLDIKKDQNALLRLMASCTKIQAIITEKYEKANEHDHNYPWSEDPSLYPSTVYILSTRMLTILGLYVNIRICENMSDAFDLVNFRRLNTQFMDKSLFSEGSLPNMYVDLMQDWVSYYENPNPLKRMALKRSLDTKTDKLELMLLNIIKPVNPNLQNESALCFHFFGCLHGRMIAHFRAIENTGIFRGFKGSLMDVMNPELLILKRTPGLDANANFAETWKRIIELEPAITSQQLLLAGLSFSQVGETTTDPATKAQNFAKAAGYYEKQIHTLKALGQNPEAYNLGNVEQAYFRVGENTTDPTTKAANFAKAATYGEERLETLKASGATPTAFDYLSIARSYFQLVENTTDPVTKAETVSKGAAYIEELLQALSGPKPYLTSYDYYANAPYECFSIAEACFQLGQYTTDPATKAESFAKAAGYFKLALSMGLDDVSANQAKDMLKAISPSE